MAIDGQLFRSVVGSFPTGVTVVTTLAADGTPGASTNVTLPFQGAINLMSTDPRVPGAVFTDPEVASVGLTEQEARAQGRKVKIGTQAFKSVARARAMGETHGFVKFVVDAKTDALLGMHLLSHFAADLLVQGILLLNTQDRSIAPIANCICVHPTLSEGVKTAATTLRAIE